jgi:four helix bundle protein
MEKTAKNLENTILNKSFALAVEGVRLSKILQQEQKEFVISKQLMRSATSIGAMVREAQQAESKADFVHKLSVALKEAKETEYWLELLLATGISNIKEIEAIDSILKENIYMLTAIIKTTKIGMEK